ncbi:hypothetical protein P3S68_001028 [Capsicum galapagoense]
MRNGPVLNHAQQFALCTDVTDMEIFEGLCSIGNEKASGVDGFNTLFFKRAWPVPKHNVCADVREFFTTRKMFKAINYTTVTLLPKVPNPLTIKEYMPITYCSVLYMLIAKVLATRIQSVIASVVSDTQAGFIPGRKGVDNIILTDELVKACNRKIFLLDA